MKTKYNQRTALAFHFACSASDIEWYQGRPGQIRLFQSGNYYYCATVLRNSPPSGYTWEQCQDDFLHRNGWNIWKSVV